MRKKSSRDEERLCPTLLEEKRLNELKSEIRALKTRLEQFEKHKHYPVLRSLTAALEDIEDVASYGWQSQAARSSGQNGSGGSGDQVVADFLLEFERGLRSFALDARNFLSDRQDQLIPEPGTSKKERYRPWIICCECSKLVRDVCQGCSRLKSAVKTSSKGRRGDKLPAA